jgi:ADP-ribose pyrophosphatase YjhB (NUDIX family)
VSDPALLLDRLRAIAHEGLEFADNPYDRRRYTQLAELVADAYEALSGVPAAEVDARFRRDVGTPTAKVGTTAVVPDAEGRILLQRRMDDGRWGLPGGWLDPGETPVQGVAREVLEETGIVVEVERLAVVLPKLARLPSGPHSMVGLTYVCRATGGELRGDHESLEVAWRAADEVTEWHTDHGRRAALALATPPGRVAAG